MTGMGSNPYEFSDDATDRMDQSVTDPVDGASNKSVRWNYCP
jgi:hypothetical protein